MTGADMHAQTRQSHALPRFGARRNKTQSENFRQLSLAQHVKSFFVGWPVFATQ